MPCWTQLLQAQAGGGKAFILLHIPDPPPKQVGEDEDEESDDFDWEAELVISCCFSSSF